MYPEKVGRVVIDGVLDAYTYQSTQGMNLLHTDEILSSFFDFCAQAGPMKCPLYAPNASKIRARVTRILAELDHKPMPVPFAPKGPRVITMDTMHTVMFTATYQPIVEFPALAAILVALEARNASALAAIPELFRWSAKFECDAIPPWAQINNEAMYAIMCSDATLDAAQVVDFAPYFAQLSALSPFFAPVWALHHLQCTEWQISAKWKYAGPLAAQATAHPLLILASTFDNVTPLEFAQSVLGRYQGARLLVQNSRGHSTFAAPSLCTARHVRAYFVDGTVPEEGMVCEVDELPFVGDTVDRHGASSRTLSVEDTELLDALKLLSRQTPGLRPF